jgi:hypothetical protein
MAASSKGCIFGSTRLGATSIVGFAVLIPETGFDSLIAVEAMNAGSSIEQETSLFSAGVVTRSLVWAIAAFDRIPTVATANKA